MLALIDAIIDEGSCCEIHPRWAQGADRRAMRASTADALGIVANQPKHKGGVLFSTPPTRRRASSGLCNAFNIPLLFLADVPGFMIGTQVERQGIIRHGAKMISAVTEATVPKISVIVRKAYGAGLYAMAGPAFEPDCCIALPSASIAVMGPQAAVNAVYYNQLQAIEDEQRACRQDGGAAARVCRRHRHRCTSPPRLVIDAVVEPERLRDELIARFAHAAAKRRDWPVKRNPVTPV